MNRRTLIAILEPGGDEFTKEQMDATIKFLSSDKTHPRSPVAGITGIKEYDASFEKRLLDSRKGAPSRVGDAPLDVLDAHL